MNKPLISSIAGTGIGFWDSMPKDLMDSLQTVMAGLVVYFITWFFDRFRKRTK